MSGNKFSELKKIIFRNRSKIKSSIYFASICQKREGKVGWGGEQNILNASLKTEQQTSF